MKEMHQIPDLRGHVSAYGYVASTSFVVEIFWHALCMHTPCGQLPLTWNAFEYPDDAIDARLKLFIVSEVRNGPSRF